MMALRELGQGALKVFTGGWRSRSHTKEGFAINPNVAAQNPADARWRGRPGGI